MVAGLGGAVLRGTTVLYSYLLRSGVDSTPPVGSRSSPWPRACAKGFGASNMRRLEGKKIAALK